MTPERFYKILLKLYPREFRDRYGEEMTRVFQESLNSQSSSFGFWVRTFWDVISSAGRERILGGRDMNNALVKIGGIAALIYGLVPILLIPFLQTQAPVMYGFNLIYNSLISFLFNAAPLGLAISGAFAYSSQAHTRVERFGFLLCMVCVASLLIQSFALNFPEFIATSVYQWVYMLIRFGLPVGLALMGFARLPKTGIKHLPYISKVLIAISAVLIVSGATSNLLWANLRYSDADRLGWIFLLIERLAWLPLAWVLLASQKPIAPSRAQPA
jgi:hypothetical protein